jgi:hypothetical protein
MVMDVHSHVRHLLRDPQVPLFITEGIKKGDALASRGCCAIALLGVWNWRGTNSAGGKAALAEWEDVALNDRLAYIGYDSDVMEKSGVGAALARLGEFVRSRGAHPLFIYLPAGSSGEKVGIDDFLAQGHTIDDLVGLATPHLRPTHENSPAESAYRADAGGLIWRKQTSSGEIEIPLTNFSATITADVIEDDGAEQRRHFVIQGLRNGRHQTIRVPAQQFAPMNWVSERLGAGAIVFPGFGTKDHARAAIQLLSGDVFERTSFTHTGWRRINNELLFLHGDGAIGADGHHDDVNVELSGAMANFRLPPPPTDGELQPALNASLSLFDLGPMSVTAPLLGATFLAPLREAILGSVYDLVVWFHGATGKFKSETVALAQAHYGPFVRTNLPLTFTATPNAVERTLFAAKDVLVVVDDFHPPSDRREEQAMAMVASRLLRGVGNGSGRQRMRADTSLRPDLPPRGLVIATGERLPSGQSTTARAFPVAVDPGAIDTTRLGAAQRQARLFPSTMSAYVSWLAAQFDPLRASLPARLEELRARASGNRMHAREPGQIAHLMLGVEVFLRFAVEKDAITATDAQTLNARAWDALHDSADQHRADAAGEAPEQRFVSLLADAFSSRRAYLEGPHGGEPSEPEAWGWERYERADGDGVGFRHMAAAPLLGRVDDDFLYLHPDATFQCVTQAASQGGQVFSVDRTTLERRLDEAGMIVCEVENEKRRRTVNHRFGSRTKRVIKLHKRALSSPYGEHGERGEQNATGEATGAASTLRAIPDVPTVPRDGSIGRQVFVV